MAEPPIIRIRYEIEAEVHERLDKLELLAKVAAAASIWVAVMLCILCALIATVPEAQGEQWSQYRGDERNSGYQPTRIERPMFLAHEIETVVGKYGNHQVDHVLVRGDSVLLLTARAGGLPRIGHTFARGALCRYTAS